MELRLVICLAIVGTLPMLGYAAKQRNRVIPGSGFAAIATDDEDPDIYIDIGSGGIENIEYVDGEGSGILEGFLGKRFPKPNVECNDLRCWCIYDDGTRVEGTEVFAKMPDNCMEYKEPTTTSPPLIFANQNVKEVSEEGPDIDIEIVDEPTEPTSMEPTTTKKTLPPLLLRRSTTSKPQSTVNNKVTVGKPYVTFDDKKEEETNEIEGQNLLYLNDVQKQDASASGLLISHPGILAAIIGGAVVGLLCAILLVMFIVYRMRKKDEGSYPLNDSKPLKDYAYSKAPSKEFYA